MIRRSSSPAARPTTAWARWIADPLHAAPRRPAGRRLVLGLTFKENVPDLRNSRVIDVVSRLARTGHQ